MNSKGQRGSTFVESLVALSLFALTAAAIGDLLVRQIRRAGTNGTTTTAISLAETELEDLRSLDYSQIVTRSSTAAVGGLTYTLRSTVASDTPADNMKSITTTITWTEAAGPQSYSAYAIYTDITR